MQLQARLTNVSGLQFFQLIRYGALILIGVLLAKSGIGKSQIGIYETFLLLSGVFSLFWVQGILKSVLPLLAQTDEEQHGPILFNTHVLLSAISMVSAVLLLALNRPISGHLLHGQPIPAPFFLAVYLVVNSPSMLTEYIYLIRNQPRRILLYAIITFSLQVVAVGLPPFLGFSVVHSIMGLLVVSGIRLVWLYSLLSQYKRLRFDLNLMKKIGMLSWPLVLATLLSSSAQYIDGFIVTAWFSPADFAVFSYGARELPLAILLANSLSMAMVPRFFGTKLDSPLAELRSEVYRLGIFLFPVTIIALLISHWAFPFVFSAEFEQSATIFNVYLMLLISRLLFPQTILMGQGLNKIIVRASLLEFVANVLLSLWFAKLFGVVGVAYATFVAYTCEKVFLAVACYRKLGIKPVKYLPLMHYFMFSAVLIVVFIFVEFIIR